MNGGWRGQGRGGGTARSGPRADAGRGEIGRNRRNSSTGERVMIGSGVVHWANLQSRAQRNGAERGIQDARTWKSEVMVAGREGEKSRTGVGAGMVCWRRKTNRAHSAVPESALIGQDKIVLRPDPPSQPPTFHPPARAHPRAAEEAGQPRNPGAPVTNARPPHATRQRRCGWFRWPISIG